MLNLQNGVAIIGCGPAGLTLALSLHQRSIPCSIYEYRDSDDTRGGSVLMSPNSLDLLNELGVYEKIRDRGYQYEALVYRNADHDIMSLQYHASEEHFGYKAVRVRRAYLNEALRNAVDECNIPIHFNMKFSHVITEDDNDGSVQFAFTNGTQTKASIVVGADGIYSAVRKHFLPNISPTYNGMLSFAYSIPTANLRLPEDKKPDYYLPTMILGKPGVFAILPDIPDGSSCLVFTQRQTPDRGREGWAEFETDKRKAVDLICGDQSEWPDTVQSALECAAPEQIALWPWCEVPRLDRWSSESGKVIIIGDAAHAVIPASGQGVNQAIEDAFSLSMMLKHVADSAKDLSVKADSRLRQSMDFWQKYRMQRMDRVQELGQSNKSKRLPEEQRQMPEKQDPSAFRRAEEEVLETSWLFQPKLREQMNTWITEDTAQV